MLSQSPHALSAPSAGVAALALVCACALPGCSSSTAFPEVGQDRATTANSVLALRIGNSPGVGADAYSTGVGRLLLVDGAGTGNSVDVGAMIDAGLVWNASGLHYGTSGAEVAVSDSGTTSVPRGKDERHELSRYSIDNGAASLAFYIDGDQQDAVAVTADGGSAFAPIPGMHPFNSVCDGHLYSMTSTRFPGNRSLPTQLDASGLQADTRPDGQGPADMLIRVDPHDDPQATIVGIAPMDEGLDTPQNEAPCYDGKIYVPTFHKTYPGANPDNGQDPTAGEPVLQVWDTTNGTRDLVPMVGDDGSPIAFSPGHLDWLVGHLSGSVYTFVTSYGEVYSTDLGTGTTRPLFTVPLTDPDSQASRFTVDAQNVFTLDVPADSEAPLTLRRDPLDGGGGEVLLTVAASPVRKGTFLTGGPRMVQAFALRPAYMEGFAR